MSDTATTKTSVAERFLRYVTYDTQSDENSKTAPSTAKQLVLLDLLVKELKELGAADAARDANGVVMATLPATSKKPNVPVVGFLAHVDTSPEQSGANVKPIVHADYRGQDLVLPDDPKQVLSVKSIPALEEQIGNDVITASGGTLLGADDKSGVAAVMAAAEYLMKHPEIARGAVKIGFTPDEEVGRGAENFDVKAFGAACAYTLDSDDRGKLDIETFSADAMIVTFQGFNTHPGYATGKMVNAIKVAADFIHRLPKDGLSPETTAERVGFVHPYVVDASVDRTSVKFIIRDFDTPKLHEKEALLEQLARETVKSWPGASVSFEVKETYRNMHEVLDKHPQVVENAKEAIRRSGLEVRHAPVRGGTDGSRLTFMGLPTPNLFTGQHNFHSRLEWVSVQDMEKAVEVIVNVCRVFEEKA